MSLAGGQLLVYRMAAGDGHVLARPCDNGPHIFELDAHETTQSCPGFVEEGASDQPTQDIVALANHLKNTHTCPSDDRFLQQLDKMCATIGDNGTLPVYNRTNHIAQGVVRMYQYLVRFADDNPPAADWLKGVLAREMHSQEGASKTRPVSSLDGRLKRQRFPTPIEGEPRKRTKRRVSRISSRIVVDEDTDGEESHSGGIAQQGVSSFPGEDRSPMLLSPPIPSDTHVNNMTRSSGSPHPDKTANPRPAPQVAGQAAGSIMPQERRSFTQPSVMKPPSSRNNADALMPITHSQGLEDMERLHQILITSVRSIATRAIPAAVDNPEMPVQRVITWVLFQTFNEPGAKVLAQLISYTTTNTQWMSYMKERAKVQIEEPEPGEPMLVARFVKLHAPALEIANTPLASLVKWQEQLGQYECLEELRALLKPGTSHSPAANQVRSYLDRTQPGKATYQHKLHAQISRKLGQARNAVYRNHRWGQRLKCLSDTFGAGIMALFGSNVMKVWSESVPAEKMDHVLRMLTTEMPYLIPLVETLTIEVYQPIMSGDRPRPSLIQQMAEYPLFANCVSTHIAANTQRNNTPAEDLGPMSVGTTETRSGGNVDMSCDEDSLSEDATRASTAVKSVSLLSAQTTGVGTIEGFHDALSQLPTPQASEGGTPGPHAPDQDATFALQTSRETN